MRWTREEYIALATGEKTDRQMLCELFGPLIGLEDEWRAQGATAEEISLRAFCFDHVCTQSVGQMGFIGRRQDVILEDTREHTITVDGMGRKMKLIKGVATIALPLSYPVSDMASWEKLKPMFAFNESRVEREALLRAKQAQQSGTLITANIPGGYSTIRDLMGDEEGCIAFCEQPELVEDIMRTVSDTAQRVLERIADVVPIDLLHVHEDMAGRSGPLIGPALIRRFIAPHYRAAWEIARASGARIFSQDSDGDMSVAIDAFMECGVTRFYPCEPTGSMDMVRLKKKYGDRIMLKGGIDKHVLRESRADIRAELEYKMQPMMQKGGVVFGLDHRIPNGTPLANYRYYVNTARELLGREPVGQDEKGWARMAF